MPLHGNLTFVFLVINQFDDRVNIKFDIDTIGHVQLDAPIYFREEAI